MAGKALYEYGLEKSVPVRILSMHDGAEAAIDNQYFPSDIFVGYNVAKAKFILKAMQVGRQSNIVILSHINLLLAAWLIKKTNPKVQIILMAHGIEVWSKLSVSKKMMLHCCDKVVSVSHFTKDKIIDLHGLSADKCLVLNNCIDPYLQRPSQKIRNENLVKRYNIKPTDIVLLTLTRLSFKDRYKGYTYVLDALVEIIKLTPNIKYILAGTYEADEKKNIDEKINLLGLQNNVVITGFLPEEELPLHFSLADIYVMPSIKEGFGIVFVEAMYYGTPVIAADADGSVDALLNGKLGLLIPPENAKEIVIALQKIIDNPKDYLPDNTLLMENFGYSKYKKNIEGILAN